MDIEEVNQLDGTDVTFLTVCIDKGMHQDIDALRIAKALCRQWIFS